jgi:hypothetical protein
VGPFAHNDEESGRGGGDRESQSAVNDLDSFKGRGDGTKET